MTITDPAVNYNAFYREACQSRTEALDGIMEALTSGHNNTIGVCGPESTANADVVEKVSRRAKKDGLFDVIVIAIVSRKPNNRRIQDEIAEALGLKFDDEKDVAKRARRLRERILMEQKVLVILRDLCRSLDLDVVGIPYGADHTGCKLLLTSASEEVLSNQMHAQKIFSSSRLGINLGTWRLCYMVNTLNYMLLSL